MKKCGIYCIENRINNKKYIGLSKDIKRRWREHKKKAFNKNSKEYHHAIYNAIRKYGLDNFDFKIIEECSQEELKEKEKYWINYYKAYEKGYNMTRGGEYNCLSEESHPFSKLTLKEVKFCRIKYAQGEESQKIYNEYFSNRISLNGFKKMWFGTTWKNVMPCVFEKKQHSRQKLTNKEILDIKTKFYNGMLIKDIAEIYKEVCSHTTIVDIVNNKRYKDIKPDIANNSKNGNKKIEPEDVILIKQLKSKGYKNKEIQSFLNKKVSLTTISDIINNKRYADIK
jgi:group I intron endonuclease